jgi:IS5 family transposase
MSLTDKDWEILTRLCEVQCTMGEILHVFAYQFSGDTIEREIKKKTGVTFKQFRKQNSASGRAKLRRLQWEAAESGNITMLIWLGKNILGQKDKSKIEHGDASKKRAGLDVDQSNRIRDFLGYAPKRK